ncbi:MAG: GGDEF domain-containing protein [Solirubrobacteraceae bacterium]
MEAEPGTLEAVAASLGVEDVLVFRRVHDDRYAHLGGLGRGVGWAGIVEFSLAEEPLARAAVEDAAPVRASGARPVRVIGPYYAAEATLVALPPDGLVVFGPGPAPADDAAAQAAAALALEAIEHVSPAKRLADELEVLHAVRALTDVEPTDVPAVAAHVAAVAAEALSCELGVLHVLDGDTVAIARRGSALEASDDTVLAAMREVGSLPLPACFQDATERPLPAPLADGVRSYLALGIDEPRRALLIVMHTEAAPRGFTQLCQQLGRRLAESAVPLLRTADARQRLGEEVERAQEAARRDCMTGLGNRLAWEEAMAAMDGQAAILLADVNGMKAANDAHGHHAGDELLRVVGDAVRGCVRESDVAARIGGDEIGVLLPGLGEAGAEAVAGRIEGALSVLLTSFGTVPSAAIGCAACLSADGLEAALRLADQRMYARKRARSIV